MAPAPLPEMMACLLQPARYPHPVDQVSLIETHGAWVLLAGAFAYKIKKPVALSFMDFSTLDKRRQACEAELRVNRQFEPEAPAQRLYLSVLPITGTVANPVLGGDAADALEWAVQMRRFPECDRLDHVAERQALTPDLLQGLARHVARVQSSAPVAAAASSWGRANDVATFALDNFPPLPPLMAMPADQATLQALARWTDDQILALMPVLTLRRDQGAVREGHGDLHLANLVKVGQQIIPFDAIEFNDALRWIDVASDIAFTWMDLWRTGLPGLAHVFLSEWLDASGDTSAPQVLPFFAVYRAMVRAKVASIRCQQLAGSPAAAGAQDEVLGYLRLAAQLAQLPPHTAAPRLMITHGLSGSGKTWASTRWMLACHRERVIRLRSDVERKRLHGLSALASSGSGINQGLYSRQAHGDTYASLLARSEALLGQGWTVVVDAAFLRADERHMFATLARKMNCPFRILACEASPDELRRRIRQRQAAGNDASEATLAVLEQQFGWLEPLTTQEREHVVLDDVGPVLHP